MSLKELEFRKGVGLEGAFQGGSMAQPGGWDNEHVIVAGALAPLHSLQVPGVGEKPVILLPGPWAFSTAVHLT